MNEGQAGLLLYYDTESIISKFSGSNKPLFLNINIQSLNSKFEKLKNFILNLTNNNVMIDMIGLALQETWLIKYPHLYYSSLAFNHLFILTVNKEGVGVSVFL